ncbi:MAG: family transcriptional regulator [Conexibacter sp.]|jgi:transcriptional regulator with XRE-family HTH domain|nr:family transcriptional regulator [Conexibacter sp.]
MEHRMQMAANIRRTRKELGWSQETLAYEAGLHATEISRLERGMGEPRPGTVTHVADALGASSGVLLSPHEEPVAQHRP